MKTCRLRLMKSWSLGLSFLWLVLGKQEVAQQQGSSDGTVPGTSVGQSIDELIVQDAQEFLDAVRSLVDGVDTVINIPPGKVVNLTSPSLMLKPLLDDEITTGSLTIRGGLGGGHSSILHLGWRTNVSVGTSAL